MKVLAVCPSPLDGTAWWRIVSPLSVMQQDWPAAFSFDIVHEVDHAKLSRYDLLLLQRPTRDGDLHALRYAKLLNIPVVVDYDDDYLDVPRNNPRSASFMAAPVQEKIRAFLTQADLVVVSSSALKKKFSALNKRVIVIPNGLDDRMRRPDKGEERLRPRTVAWRGGDSHNEDLMLFGDQIVRASWDKQNAFWHFIGSHAFEITSRMPPHMHATHPFTDVLSYFMGLGQLRPHILIVPLANTSFNECKSNISILEGTWAGAVVLAPDWKDWRAPGVVNYTSTRDFGDKLIGLLQATDAELTAMNTQAWASVTERGLASRSNVLRAAAFSEVHKLVQAERFARPDPKSTVQQLVEAVEPPQQNRAARRAQK